MFKGFTNELKTKIEQFNRNNSKRFIFCFSDLQESSDRGSDSYGDKELKFDIISPELRKKLENEVGVSNPTAIKFVDSLMHTSENIFSAPSPSVSTYLKLSGINKYDI
ncbi:5529_t:CDS:1 [Funneliformis geosporum]|uniref:5529_t:CDS:1 n=1 Tax=Funneliformis geosporum TaxID=1117311 RepID=A0A9W4S9N1_9GLOM|nr:5529_t:CDS:1 [Funneliformis geosporum]